MSEQFTPTTGDLRKIAENATPGPWESMGRFIETKEWVEGQDGDIVSPEVECMAYCYGGSARGIGNPSDAEFIATFNPEMVLALLDRVEAAEQALQRVRDRHQPCLSCLEPHCFVCEKAKWPCAEFRALEGDDA